MVPSTTIIKTMNRAGEEGGQVIRRKEKEARRKEEKEERVRRRTPVRRVNHNKMMKKMGRLFLPLPPKELDMSDTEIGGRGGEGPNAPKTIL
mmetsp:Transcript_71800/g.126471  ORF Transcript_71800/g.126471 Transcript_71800/m.126471 type:complete len:92 (+) Transcript_71800:1206-1481(+)